MEGFKKGAFFSVSLSALGKVFSFLSSLLIAFLFGSTLKTDIYFYLILVAALLNAWLQGINTNLVIPEFIHRYQKNKTNAIDFANFFLFIYIIFSLVIILATLVFPIKTLTLISDFSQNQARQSSLLIILGSFYFCSFFIMSFLINLCEAFKLFKIYLLIPLNSILPLLLLACTKKIEGMFIGFIIAYTIQIVFSVYLIRTKGAWYWSFKQPSLTKKFKKDFWAMQPNNISWMLLTYSPLWLISGMQAGLVSAINYARMISDTPQDVLTFKINSIAKIKLTQEAAKQDKKALQNTLLRTDRFLSFLLIPICAFTAVFAKDIVEMIFMRGHFTQQDAVNTAFFLQFFIISVPIFTLNTNFTSLLSSMQLIKETALRYTLINTCSILIFILAIKNYGAFIYPILWLVLNLAIMLCNIVTAKNMASFLNYPKHNMQTIIILISSILLAYLIKQLNFYEGNIFIKIFVNGITFVAFQAFLFYKSGYLKQIKEALNV